MATALAKLTRPKLCSAIPRARLFQRLDQAREHAAIWVCGPPGAGKTRLVASYVSKREIPSMKIGVLYQDDDYGKGFVEALKEALAGQPGPAIVAEASYAVTDPSIDPQIIALRGAGADTLFDFSTPKFGSFAIRKAYDMGWRPLHFVTGPSTSMAATLAPARLEKAMGLMSAGHLKDPSAAEWQDDAATKEWLAWMKHYSPDGDVADWLNVYGYTSAQALVYVLQRCGDNLTRENVMREAANIRELALPMLLPGIPISTSPADFYPIRQIVLRRFDGKAWGRVGAPAAHALHATPASGER